MGLFNSLKKAFGRKPRPGGSAAVGRAASEEASEPAAPATPEKPRGRPLSERITIEPPVVDAAIISLQRPAS